MRPADHTRAHTTPPTLALVALLLTTCGDPLVGPDYRGEPLFSFEGEVLAFRNIRPSGDPLRVSLFWSPSGSTTAPLAELVEQASVSVAIDFPAAVEVNIFHPPPEGTVPAAYRDYGVGVVLVYEDRDGNGRLTPDAHPSELIGGSASLALLYTPAPIAADRSPTGQPLPAGFVLVHLPLRFCDGANPFPADDLEQGQDCGVSLGAACTGAGDCGAGACLGETGAAGSYPGGYCVLLYDPDGCEPRGGVIVEIPDPEGLAPPATYWMRGCQVEADCGGRQGYTCDQGSRLCLPEAPVWFELADDFEMTPLCEAPDERLFPEDGPS